MEIAPYLFALAVFEPVPRPPLPSPTHVHKLNQQIVSQPFSSFKNIRLVAFLAGPVRILHLLT